MGKLDIASPYNRHIFICFLCIDLLLIRILLLLRQREKQLKKLRGKELQMKKLRQREKQF